MQNRYNLNYKFSYDYSNRLLSAQNINQGDNTYSTYNTYDKDGNITTLKRYGDNNTLKDDFNYQYYPNTNKIKLVTGAVDQFSFDLNGNTMLDDINGNYDIKYDYRNLITELYHKDPASETRPNTYATRYYYDDSGNRVRKLVYINSQVNPPLITDWNNPGNGWTLFNNEFYVKGVDGKDLAIYKGNVLEEWFVWGNDVVGKIKNGIAYYFYKDHLGSVRAVVRDNGAIIAAYDYDAWGYPLENRNYNGDSIKFKYTGKELDKESFYDYFGARYYDSRIANWTSVDPLLEKHFDFSPYNYVLRNPNRYIDPNGKQVEVVVGAAALAEAAVITGLAVYSGYQLYQIYNKYFSSNGESIFQMDKGGELVFPNPIAEIGVISTFKESKKLKGLESQFRNIEEHLGPDKLGGLKPDAPDPHNDRGIWKLHIIKAIQEMYKDFRQAFKNIKGKDFQKYLEDTFGKENMENIYEQLRKNNIDFEKYIK